MVRSNQDRPGLLYACAAQDINIGGIPLNAMYPRGLNDGLILFNQCAETRSDDWAGQVQRLPPGPGCCPLESPLDAPG